MKATDMFSWLTGSEMGGRIRAFDWSRTPLGPIEQWPASLVSILGVCLTAQTPMAIYWGADSWLLYNDAWRPVVGGKHPWALGHPAREVWPELWPTIQHYFHSVLNTGEANWRTDELLPMQRFGYTEECYFDYSLNPIRGQSGAVEGILNIVQETTYRVLNDRRTSLLRELASLSGSAQNDTDACARILQALATDSADVPFALLYQIDRDHREAQLAGSIGLEDASLARQEQLDLTGNAAPGSWPLAAAIRNGGPLLLDELPDGFGLLPGGAWPEPTRQCLLLPIGTATQDGGVVLVAGISPRRPLDEHYHHFFRMVSSHIAVAINNARAYQSEQRRAEALAELDRAKTAFFSNVSHELRTPLTLMLGPLEEELHLRPQSPALEVAHRNSLRLLKLVNTLLDFSRIEAGRAEASYQPTDLAAYSADLASGFRSAIEKAGVTFVVDCPPLPEAVYVDRSMWEKIVLNLLSNAFKHTFQGQITISMRHDAAGAELVVSDTGVGIPDEALPRLFERFFRVQNRRSRTHEGSGIGLALVQEVVRLHGGSVQVESRLDEGSTFTVRISWGTAHLPAEQIRAGDEPSVRSASAVAYVQEALHWLPDTQAIPPPASTSEAASAVIRPRVLVADDNADMRQYIERLLSRRYDVVTVGDGLAALNEIRRHPPDLLLSDIMMPQLDGIALLKALRADPAVHTLPVILLSARAGEESRVEGLEQGADDYLVKPFSAQELMARVTTHLDLSRIRRKAEQEITRSKLFLERIAASTPDLLFVFDLLRTRTVYINHSLKSVLGYDVEQLAATQDNPIVTLVHPDDVPSVEQWLGRFDSAADAEVLEHKHRLRHADGTYRWILMRASVFDRSPEGRARQIIGIAKDTTDQLRAEELMAASEARYRAIVSQATASVAQTDLTGRFVFVNQRFCDILGYDQAELLDLHMQQITDPEDLPHCLERFQQLVNGGPDFVIEKRYRRKDGTAIWMSVSVGGVREGQDLSHIVAVGLDITERKQQETRLLALSGRQQMLYELADAVNRAEPVASLYDIALETMIRAVSADRASVLLFDQDGVMRFKAWRGLSDEYRKAVEGHSPWSADQRNPPPLFIPDLATADLDPQLQATIRHEGVQALAFVPLTYGGQLLGKFMLYFDHPHRMSDEDVGWTQTLARTLALGIERAKADDLLRSSEERLRLAMAAGRMGAWDLNLVTGETTWDERQYELFGRSADCPIRQASDFYSAIHPDDVARVQEAARLGLETGVFSSEFRILTADGTIRWLAGQGATVADEQGQVVRMVGINYDITERKRVEEDLQRSAAELERRVAERTIELTQSREHLRALATELNLAGQRERQHLATELHDYLAQLLALSRIRLAQAMQQPLSPPLAKTLNELQDVTNQALTYTRTLVAQLSPPILKEFGLPMALSWLAEQMLQRDLRVSLQLGPERLPLPEDQAMLLFQSVRELLMNVVKHASVKEAFITVRVEEGCLQITVADRGTGFAESDHLALRKGGQVPGFGLFSIRERMLALGGRLEVHSQPGQGTEATLIAPLTPPSEQDRVPSASRRAQIPHTVPSLGQSDDQEPINGRPLESARQIRVLIADDHAMVRQGLCGLLAGYGDIQVVAEAANGSEALALARQWRPEVVLMDVNMPVMDGIEATRRIKDALPDTIVIGLSVQTIAHVGHEMREAGAVAFLNKEAAVEDLYQTIQTARKELLSRS
ncbi:MAG TPA: PAS domain S-box protein [Nitrospira sp.]|nr:PAS domain S-box protein [Nitrospira sp.]